MMESGRFLKIGSRHGRTFADLVLVEQASKPLAVGGPGVASWLGGCGAFRNGAF